MWDKLIELSKLEIFAKNDIAGQILFVIVLIAVIFGIIVVLKQVIWGLNSIWTKTCSTIEEVKRVSAEVEKEEIRSMSKSKS